MLKQSNEMLFCYNKDTKKMNVPNVLIIYFCHFCFTIFCIMLLKTENYMYCIYAGRDYT